jgi:membrane-bound acyltransferase YfiQ involved in biofilm formation
VLLLAVGVRFNTGVPGILAIFAMLILFAMGWSCISMIAALRTQNARLVQSMFILVFPFLYYTRRRPRTAAANLRHLRI